MGPQSARDHPSPLSAHAFRASADQRAEFFGRNGNGEPRGDRPFKNKVSRDSEMRQRFLNNRLKNGSDSEEQLVFEVRVFTRSEQECVRVCACVCECAGQAEFPKNRVVMTLSLGNNKMRVFLETSRILF